MITVTSCNGIKHYLAPDAIARITEAGVSGKWHGINSHLKCFDGQVIDCRESPDEIAAAIRRLAEEAKEQAKPGASD